MSFYVPGISDMEERSREEKEARENALYRIANYYNRLSEDEKEGLKRLIKEKGEEVRKERLLKERDKLNKELGIMPESPELLNTVSENNGPDDYAVLNKLYEHVCKEFQRVTNELLGKDYYNMGMDQYTCTTMTADDLISKYKKYSKRR